MESIRDLSGHIHPYPVFIKFSPLLDPIRYMIGKYDIDDVKLKTLPSINRDQSHPKLELVHNASYVDGFFSYLSSQLLNTHGVLHGIDYYGSYLLLQDKYKMLIEDDLEYLTKSEFFNDHLNKLFTISSDINYPDLKFMNYGSRSNKEKLVFDDTNPGSIYLDIEELDDFLVEQPNNDNSTIENNDNNKMEDALIYEKQVEGSQYSSTNTSNTSEMNYSSDEDDSIESEENENSDSEYRSNSDNESLSGSSTHQDDEPNMFAYINRFPVQMICLEKCAGTLDDLFAKYEIDEHEGASALFQVIMTLIIYQKAFHFTHNDLHTNNIMYTNTDQEFLYYEYESKKYCVPTYGKIFKLIDFGRSIYKFQDQLLCSDSFFNGGDAATQYNFGPFFNENKPRLEPNYSFDLCRLGCSIYDFIIDDNESMRDMDDFQKTILRWCTDDYGKNILYKKNGEERNPNFKLYKMIARTVHNHTPQEQLKFPFFSQFALSAKKWKQITGPIHVMNIDKLPCYV